MSLPRHNEGKFQRYADSAHTKPVINGYHDAYSYIVKSPKRFLIEDAVAAHLFNLRITEEIAETEGLRNAKYSDQEIDDIIKHWTRKDIEEIILEGSARHLLEHRNLIVSQSINSITPTRRNVFLSTLSGAWQNVLGNALGFIIIIVATLVVSSYVSADPVSPVRKYYNECVGIFLPTQKADDSKSKTGNTSPQPGGAAQSSVNPTNPSPETQPKSN